MHFFGCRLLRHHDDQRSLEEEDENEVTEENDERGAKIVIFTTMATTWINDESLDPFCRKQSVI